MSQKTRSTFVLTDPNEILGALVGLKDVRVLHYQRSGPSVELLIEQGWGAREERRIPDLNAFYQEARARFDSDPEFAERARRRVVALQAGDPETMAVWRELVAESVRQLGSKGS